MKIDIENQEDFDDAGPDDILAVVAYLDGHKMLSDLSINAGEKYKAIEGDETIPDKDAAKQKACEGIIVDFHKVAYEYLNQAAFLAGKIIREARQLVGEDLQTPEFNERYVLVLPVPKKVTQKLAEALAQKEGIERVYINTGVLFDANNGFRNKVEYYAVDPRQNMAEREQTSLLRIIETSNDMEVFDLEILVNRAELSSRRSQLFLINLKK